MTDIRDAVPPPGGAPPGSAGPAGRPARDPGSASARTPRERRRRFRRGRSDRHEALGFWQRVRRDKVMLALMLPGFVYFVLFHYAPLLGYAAAFEDYQPYLGFFHSLWTGTQNFSAISADPAFWSALGNTFKISLIQLVLFFPAPIGLALLLNSIMNSKIRGFVQSVVYLPHFIGWVVIIAIFQQVLGPTGLVPHALGGLGLPRFDAMSSPGFFPWLIALESIWKDCGWGTIIFLAALMNIDTALYEAAVVDGAGRWHRFRSVTLPGITPIAVLLLILQLGTIVSVGFEQILLQRNSVGPAAGEVLDTYVYFHGVQAGDWGPAAAVGLIKAVVGLVLVLSANKAAHWMGQEGVYRRDTR